MKQLDCSFFGSELGGEDMTFLEFGMDRLEVWP